MTAKTRDQVLLLQARAMGEETLQSLVLELAQVKGWRRAHFRPARTAKGWRTPVMGDGAGFPDLLLLRGNCGLAIELKAQDGHLSSAQAEWLAAFAVIPGFRGGVWRPMDWLDGSIKRALL